MRNITEISGSVVRLECLKYGTLEEKSMTSRFLDDQESDLIDTDLCIQSNLTFAKIKSLLKKDNLAFRLYLDVESRQLFAYELNGNIQHERILAEVTRQIGNYATLTLT
jgi:hypothetical protein